MTTTDRTIADMLEEFERLHSDIERIVPCNPTSQQELYALCCELGARGYMHGYDWIQEKYTFAPSLKPDHSIETLELMEVVKQSLKSSGLYTINALLRSTRGYCGTLQNPDHRRHILLKLSYYHFPRESIVWADG